MISLLDAEARAQAFPGSFEVPTFDVRYTVNVGDLVKLAFLVPEKHAARLGYTGCEAERMWVEVTEIVGVCGLKGKLRNQPAVLKGLLSEGDSVEFWTRNILATERP